MDVFVASDSICKNICQEMSVSVSKHVVEGFIIVFNDLTTIDLKWFPLNVLFSIFPLFYIDFDINGKTECILRWSLFLSTIIDPFCPAN
ncbi:hypothetical protein FKM82_023898 [Ascaphus truei]